MANSCPKCSGRLTPHTNGWLLSCLSCWRTFKLVETHTGVATLEETKFSKIVDSHAVRTRHKEDDEQMEAV